MTRWLEDRVEEAFVGIILCKLLMQKLASFMHLDNGKRSQSCGKENREEGGLAGWDMVLVSNCIRGGGWSVFRPCIALVLVRVGVWVDFNRSISCRVSTPFSVDSFDGFTPFDLPFFFLDSRPFSWLETRTYQIWDNVASVS